MTVAGAIHAEMRKLIKARMDTTFKKLIAAHGAGGLNDGTIRGIVGELASLHFLLDDAERMMKREREGEIPNG